MFSIYQATKNWSELGSLSSVCIPQTTSTNLDAKNAAGKENQALVLYVTDEQTAGRGRGDHTWQSPAPGTSLLSTWSLQTRKAPQPILAPAIGLALFKSAQTTWLGHPWSLKAPNDLYLGDKKVAGLLLENIQEGPLHRLLVGLGLNVFSNPQVASSGALSEQISPEELTAEVWMQFLDRWLLELTSTMMVSTNELSAGQCLGLKTALNLYPKVKTPVAHVQKDGGLELENGKLISWFEL